MADATTRIRIVVDGKLGSPALLALDRLRQALDQRGYTVAEDYAAVVIRVGISATDEPGASLRAAGAQLSDAPESLAFAFVDGALAIGGADDRGLAYALREAARRIDLAPAPLDWEGLFPPASESPFLRKRSVCIFPHNEAVDGPWYFNPAFWEAYFDKLSLNRFNAFSLTFGHQTAYLVPPYAFLVPMPEFPDVTVPSLSDEQRERHLATLQMISRTAVERGIDFTFGVWQQHSYEYGESLVEGLTLDNLAAYCELGMAKVLKACPDISGVQLRVNSESGIEAEDSPAFFRSIYSGVVAAGREIEIDVRAKAIADDTWEGALDTGLPTTVSTKFWCEQQGMPYSAGLLQDFDRMDRRHSYGDLLKFPRDYDFMFRMWNLGTNKFTLWGDPAWVRRYAESCALGDSKGFEVCAPLSNKGFRNVGGAWPLFKPQDMHWCEFEDERYWFWYLLFGRLGYDPACSADVWEREFNDRFGADAAVDVQEAVVEGSHYLPFITAAHLPSASVFGWWAERDTGGLLDAYIEVEPSDLAGFYGVSEYVEDYLAGELRAKLTPLQIAERLESHAAAAEAALERGRRAVPGEARAEFLGIEADVRLCSGLARYHAHKLRAALDLAFFYLAGAADRLQPAKVHMTNARDQWQAIVEHTDGLYDDEMIFGPVKDESGTWKRLTPYLDHDLARLDEVEGVFECFGLFAHGFDFGAEPVDPRPWIPRTMQSAWVERRFRAVSPDVNYTPARGIGWKLTRNIAAVSPPPTDNGDLLGRNREVGELPHRLLELDFQHRGRNPGYVENTFRADLAPGMYDVTVVMGDTAPDAKDRGPMWLTFQGRHQTDRFTIPAGQVIHRTQRCNIANGRLELEVNSHPASDWVINALVVREVAPQIGHVPICSAAPGPLPVTATVTAPDGVAEVALNWRAGDSAWQRTPMAADGAVFSAEIQAPDLHRIDYFIEATDAGDESRSWPAAGADAPQPVAIGTSAGPPSVHVQSAAAASPGQNFTVTADVDSAEDLASVILYYRDLNQRELYTPVPMRQIGGAWTATIPGMDIVPDWDLMYYVEAIDRLGNGAIGPDLDVETPYVVVPVERG